MTTHAYTAQRASSRTVSLLFIAGLHVLLAYGLIVGLRIHPYVPPYTKPIVVRSIDDPVVKLDVVDTPVDPSVQRIDVRNHAVDPPIFVDATLTQDDPTPSDPLGALPATGQEVPDAAPLLETPLRYAAVRSPDDYYPAVAANLGERGSTIVRVCVGADGVLIGAPTVESSAGHSRWSSNGVLQGVPV